MPSGGRVRVLVFSLFFLALIIFAVVYRPENAMSRPATQKGPAVPASAPAQIR